MMTKIKLNFEQIKELAALSISNGTEKAFISLVLQWAEEANKYIHSEKVLVGWTDNNAVFNLNNGCLGYIWPEKQGEHSFPVYK